MPEKTTPDSLLVVDISGWKMKQFKKWQRAALAGDLDAMQEMMVGVVRSWPFAGQPNDPDAYDDLAIADFMKIGKAIGEQVTELFRAA